MGQPGVSGPASNSLSAMGKDVDYPQGRVNGLSTALGRCRLESVGPGAIRVMRDSDEAVTSRPSRLATELQLDEDRETRGGTDGRTPTARRRGGLPSADRQSSSASDSMPSANDRRSSLLDSTAHRDGPVALGIGVLRAAGSRDLRSRVPAARRRSAFKRSQRSAPRWIAALIDAEHALDPDYARA